MNKIFVGMSLLFCVLFSSSCATNQQGKIQTSKNQENGKAEYKMGEKYFEGKGVTINYVKAAEWFRKAAEIGNADAQYFLGGLYYIGEGVPQDFAEAAKWCRKAAEQGNADAQTSVGIMYRYGQGVPQDYVKAVKYYRKAAEQGIAEAQFRLGGMYFKGQGVPQDDAKGAEWLRKAAEQGDADAQTSMGTMYKYGYGVPQDYVKAVKYYRKAAEQGNANAQNSLGDMYYKGQGVPQDYAKAVKYYHKAAEQGNAEAQGSLGIMYYRGEGIPKDYEKALKWCQQAAEQGNANAQLYLGHMYIWDKGIPQDYTKAAKWCRKAAEQGNANAQYSLGNMYRIGQGVPQDYTLAAEWFRKAVEQGNVLARLLARHGLGKLLEKTAYPDWECLDISDTEYYFINKNKIRQQGNLVWFWTMEVPFQESHSGKKRSKNSYVADCDSARLGFVSYINYDSNGKIIRLHTFKESEIDMNPAVPGSMGEGYLEYACSHAKTGTYKKKETTKAGACFGTGWSVASGFVVTNNHVVEGHNHIILIRPDGVKIPATVVSHDEFNDLALLKVEDTGLLPAALPLSSKPAVLGEKVVTIGYPHPDLLGVKPKLTEGVINSTSGLGDDPRALQISVPIQAGNSGGPLVNMEGRVVGIVTSKIDAVKMFKWTGDLPQNINYGIKISYLNGLLSSVLQKQRIDTLAPFKYTSVQGLAKKIRNSVLMIMAN